MKVNKMNKNQKIILAVFIPIVIFFIALMIANNLGYTEIARKVPESSVFRKYLGETTTYYKSNPFDWERTWYVWFIYSVFCCVFEFLLFRDNKIIPRKNKVE